MVNHFTISCPNCAKIFDEATRRPCLGTCGHSICHECHDSQDTKHCPICRKEDAFGETVINYQSEQLLKGLRDQLTPENFLTISKDVEILDHGKCSECSSFSTKLRICVNCVKPHKIISEDFENSWRLELVEKNYERSFLKAKSFGICADCALGVQHEQHKVIPLRSVNCVPRDNDFRANGALLVQKLTMENAFGDCQGLVTHFKSVLVRFHLRISMRKENFLEGLPSIKIPSNPNWEQKMKASREATGAIHRRNERWMDRMLKFEESHLQKYTEHLTLKWTTSEGQEAENLEKVLLELQDVLQKIQSVTDLLNISDEEVEEIDQETERTMTRLEAAMRAGSLLDDDDDVDSEDKFFKYKVIALEYEQSTSSIEVTKQQMLKKVMELRNLEVKYSTPLKNCQQDQKVLEEDSGADFLNQLQKCVISSTKMYVYMHELVEKQLELDQFVTRYLEATGRKKQADLMMYRYFPMVPGRTAEDQAYVELVDELVKQKVKDSLNVLF